MRRPFLLLLPAVLALVPASPGVAGTGVCVSSGGVTVCPTAVMRCTANDTIRVTVLGPGQGTVSCGGATTSCFSFRVTCTAEARTTSSGPMTCSSTHSAVATCSIVAAAN